MDKTKRDRSNPLVIALDVETSEHALALVSQLKGLAGMFKIGKQLFTAEGPSIVRRICELGEQVFLDLKFHDIPNTVAKAGVEATRLGVAIFNLHALGGRAMMARTVDSVREAADYLGVRRPIILGVTVLTSHDAESLREIGVSHTVEEEVARLASLCDSAGIDGVVASALEIAAVRRVVTRPDFVVLVPGIRPAGTGHNDQSRVLTPGEAISAGANYLVVGRPITAAKDPAAAAQKIVEEIELAVASDV